MAADSEVDQTAIKARISCCIRERSFIRCTTGNRVRTLSHRVSSNLTPSAILLSLISRGYVNITLINLSPECPQKQHDNILGLSPHMRGHSDVSLFITLK